MDFWSSRVVRRSFWSWSSCPAENLFQILGQREIVLLLNHQFHKCFPLFVFCLCKFYRGLFLFSLPFFPCAVTCFLSLAETLALLSVSRVCVGWRSMALLLSRLFRTATKGELIDFKYFGSWISQMFWRRECLGTFFAMATFWLDRSRIWKFTCRTVESIPAPWRRCFLVLF